MLKKYVAMLIQTFFWCGYTVAEWLSGKDHFIYKLVLFIVFLYLAFLTARKIVESNRISIIVTITSLGAYGIVYFILDTLNRLEILF
ncbi:hypothetical protein [Lederbergia graminis]|uniref:Uncharacterized protein n=1 Tax=Lederbergia graminis TaxID=735518 RepID=A0ABW0LDX4_9BACI|nr:hypothetical protein [Bacillaceae bacterium]